MWELDFGGGAFLTSHTCLTLDGSDNLYIAANARETFLGPSGEPPLVNTLAADNIAGLVVMKIDPDGAYQWHHLYGTYGEYAMQTESAGCMHIDDNGSLLVSGMVDGGGLIAPQGQTPLNTYVPGDYNYDILLKLDTDGRYYWHMRLNPGSYAGGFLVAGDHSDGIYLHDWYDPAWNYTEPFLSNPPLYPYAGSRDALLIKLKDDPPNLPPTLKLYPMIIGIPIA